MENIRTGLTEEGHIEAAYYPWEIGYARDVIHRVVIDRRTGNVVTSTVREGSDSYRKLVNAARAVRRQYATPAEHFK